MQQHSHSFLQQVSIARQYTSRVCTEVFVQLRDTLIMFNLVVQWSQDRINAKSNINTLIGVASLFVASENHGHIYTAGQLRFPADWRLLTARPCCCMWQAVVTSPHKAWCWQCGVDIQGELRNHLIPYQDEPWVICFLSCMSGFLCKDPGVQAERQMQHTPANTSTWTSTRPRPWGMLWSAFAPSGTETTTASISGHVWDLWGRTHHCNSKDTIENNM